MHYPCKARNEERACYHPSLPGRRGGFVYPTSLKEGDGYKEINIFNVNISMYSQIRVIISLLVSYMPLFIVE